MDQSSHFMCHWKIIPHSKSGLRAVQAQLTINKLTHRCLLDTYEHIQFKGGWGEARGHETKEVVTRETERTVIMYM